ncbi:HEAT repeat domain-containing protein [Salinarimonas soli]|uniref:HEAT repeat domain-containing protein n=1 Tax=Salinarimonas soli TaxID=1638099 RepID=A0A5B2VDT0_9HYPH|nr:HEAT repeat domain-containing protein [Salinarimonas soli]KAA2236277.1 HEAT repeat domain-containing protein [Salinarimonas soli]
MPLIRKPSPAAPDAVPARDPLAALRDGSPDERFAAARAAGGLPGGVPALAGALSREADPRVREAILTSLSRAGTPEAVAAILPHVHADDANLRAGTLDALRVVPGGLGPHLPGLLADPDPDVRLLACDLARGLPAGEAVALLVPILDADAEANVCAAAVEVLAEIAGPDALPALEACARRFPGDPFLPFAVRIAAGRIGARTPAPDE